MLRIMTDFQIMNVWSYPSTFSSFAVKKNSEFYPFLQYTQLRLMETGNFNYMKRRHEERLALKSNSCPFEETENG